MEIQGEGTHDFGGPEIVVGKDKDEAEQEEAVTGWELSSTGDRQKGVNIGRGELLASRLLYSLLLDEPGQEGLSSNARVGVQA